MSPTDIFLTFRKDFWWPSRAKGIIGRDLKFAGYIRNPKILAGNIFGLTLKNKMSPTDIFLTFRKDFWWPSRAKGIIGRDLKFAEYVPHYKMWTGNIFVFILKSKMAATGISLSVIKSAYISLIISQIFDSSYVLSCGHDFKLAV